MQKKTLRKWNIIIHRDLGYFFAGMCIIYGLSGIALNHLDDWNPSYLITNKEFHYTITTEKPSKEELVSWLKESEIEEKYKKHYTPSEGQLKIFLESGSVEVDLSTKKAILEIVKRRPIFYHMNLLHYNPGVIWKWFSDLFGAALVTLAISGMFILRGKKGLMGRGKWLVGAGILIPLILLFNYL